VRSLIKLKRYNGEAPLARLDLKVLSTVKKELITAVNPVLNLTGWENPNHDEMIRLWKICM
jgi:hypothetical protein